MIVLIILPQETNLPVSDHYVTVSFVILFGAIVTMMMTNLLLAIMLDLLTVNAQKDAPEVMSDKAQVFSLLWATILKRFGSKNDPLDLLRKNRKSVEVYSTSCPNIYYDHAFKIIRSCLFNL